MAIYRGSGGATDTTDQATIDEVTEQAGAAAASATAAASSASSASTSASNASTSASQAATSATSASTSASQATSSKNAAATSATAAEAAKVEAEAAQAAAENAEANAITYGTNAVSSASEAATSATAAQTARDVTQGYRDDVIAYDSSASDSASAAASSATAAASSATAASDSADEAATSASNAATSATNAATSETNAASSASTASTQATAASASAATASTQAANAATSATNSANSATASATSATNAATSETNAANSATAAAGSATSAASSASSASTSASTATAAKDAALAALDSFDDRYLGTKTSDPTVDNDGNALIAGALYFNTTDDTMKVYEGSQWVAAYASLSDAVLETGGTMSGNLAFGDNNKAIFGAGSDLQIYHDGSESYISDVGAGNLRIEGANVVINGTNGNRLATFASGDRVELQFNGSEKLRTTSTGIDVTGTATMDGAEIAKASSMTQLKLERTTTAAGSGYLGASADHCLVAQDSAGLYRAAVHQNGDLSLYEDTGTTAKFFWDASAESLGIGTTSPQTILEALSTTPMIRLQDDQTAVVAGTDMGGIEWRTADSSVSGANRITGEIRVEGDGTFGGTDQAPSRMIFSTHASSGVAPVERMRITSAGDLLVGTASGYATIATTSTESGHVLSPTAGYAVSRAGAPILGNRYGSDGDIAVFRKDGTTVGSIGSYAGTDTYITGGSGNNTGIVIGSGYVVPSGSAGGSNSNVDLGLNVAGRMFKDLYLSGGVYLGGTGASNHLQDYEEGTWTPSITFGGANTGMTYSSQLGTYVKVGNVVHAKCYLNLSSKGTSTGNVLLNGLPFSTGSGLAYCTFAIWINNLLTGGEDPTGYAHPTGTFIYLQKRSSGVTSIMQDTDFANNSEVMVQITYEA